MPEQSIKEVKTRHNFYSDNLSDGFEEQFPRVCEDCGSLISYNDINHKGEHDICPAYDF